MNRIITWIATVLILATTSTLASAQAISKESPVYIKIAGKATSKIPLIDWMKFAIDQADAATRQRSKISANATERGYRNKGQLISGTINVDIEVDHTDYIWRGSIYQRLTMPCTVTLALDLDELLANTSYNTETKKIEVYLPQLSVIAVENHISKYSTITVYNKGCWEWYDARIVEKMEVSLLKSDWGALAREKVNPHDNHHRDIAKSESIRFLQGLIEPIIPNVTIEIRQ